MTPPSYQQGNNDVMTTPLTVLPPPTETGVAQDGVANGGDANIPVVYATIVPPSEATQAPVISSAPQPTGKFSVANNNISTAVVPVPVPVPTTSTALTAKPPTALTTTTPTALTTAHPTALTTTAMNETVSPEVKQLMKQGFTKGLAQALASCTTLAFPQRIWIVDNSGSMQMNDGHRLLGSNSYYRLVDSTRWDEIRDCVNYHIEMASLLKAPTSFRLLNDPQVVNATQFFSVAGAEDDPEMIKYQAENALSIMRLTRPRGVTPLTQHVNEIHQQVFDMAPQLNLNGQKVVIVIATDGLPSDPQGRSSEHEKQMFVDALRSLEGLPVWLVIRLCTDEDAVVDFYNTLDSQLELSLEVLDDFVGEAKEVYEHNNWLTYGLALHRCREMGFHDRLFDLMDERSLTRSEIRDFCMVLFGQDKFDGVPDPEMDWDAFVRFIEQVVKTEEMQWNPITKSMSPWINIRKLQRVGNPPGCNNLEDIADTINFILKQLFPRK